MSCCDKQHTVIFKTGNNPWNVFRFLLWSLGTRDVDDVTEVTSFSFLYSEIKSFLSAGWKPLPQFTDIDSAVHWYVIPSRVCCRFTEHLTTLHQMRTFIRWQDKYACIMVKFSITERDSFLPKGTVLPAVAPSHAKGSGHAVKYQIVYCPNRSRKCGRSDSQFAATVYTVPISTALHSTRQKSASAPSFYQYYVGHSHPKRMQYQPTWRFGRLFYSRIHGLAVNTEQICY
jgi:hypothetical protein